ncbi:MAG: long-chain fatty acid--CoA ligase, partial [Bacteroidetes bacterium HGW-Bacteroidetes-22]
DLLKERKALVKPSDMASIIYTSGTTSEPKGVMLSHANHVSNFLIASFTIRLRPNEAVLSYLPLSHSYERMVNYVFQYIGLKIYYTESVNNILSNFHEVKPQILVTVPLLLERVYEGILKKGMKLSWPAKLIFNRSLVLANRYRHGEEMGWWYNFQLNIAHRLVFSKWQAVLGGRMKKIICGGAKVQPHLLRIFWAAGIPVFEGYGLTEASPLVAYNTEDDFRPGTIGKPIADLLVRISIEGELMVKGPGVMMGYYRQPELTQQAVDVNGWLHTGDKAEMDDDGFLRITGRIKEIFKVASGVYVYPETLENKLKQSFFIANCMVVGEHRNYLAAVITVNFDYLREWCAEHHIEAPPDNSVLLSLPKVKAQLDADVKRYGQSPKESENIARWLYTADDWSVDTGELSPSLKLRRRFVHDRYRDVIPGMF